MSRVTFSPKTPERGGKELHRGLLEHHPAEGSPGMTIDRPIRKSDLDVPSSGKKDWMENGVESTSRSTSYADYTSTSRSTSYADYKPRSTHQNTFHFSETERYISSPEQSRRAATAPDASISSGINGGSIHGSHGSYGSPDDASKSESSDAIFGSASR